MRESGVNTQQVRIVPNRSVELYLITLNNGERSFTYWRGQSAARLLAQDKQALAHAMTQSDLIYFSGVTLAILNPEPPFLRLFHWRVQPKADIHK